MQMANQLRPLTHIQGLWACPTDEAPRMENVTIVNDIIRRVREEAKRKSVRWTNQRQVIVETFIGSDDHITVEDLHHRVRSIDRTISAATV